MAGERRSILVTGGAGYIGSHACKALSRSGYLPVTYDNLSTGHRDAVKWGPFVHGDVLDAARLRAAISEAAPLAVMHFAASAYVGESVGDPLKYYGNNVTGMISLLEAMQACGVGKLVFSSSCATYGEPQVDLIAEATPQAPINPYGRTKLMCEQIIADFAGAGALDHAVLRYFNAAGADPDGELAERHDPETHLIPLVLYAALGRTDGFKVFGDDYPTPDGTCIRDFIHVSDLADGHVLALDALLDGTPSFTVNLGSGRGHSILDVIAACEASAETAIPRTVAARRPGDPPRLVADTARAAALLGFRPKRSDLATITATAYAAMRGRAIASR